MRQNLTILAAGLRGSSTLIEDDGALDPARFQEFARDVLRRTPFSRLGFSQPVSPSEREAFEQELGEPITRIRAGGRLVPIGEDVDREFLPISLVHPDTPGPADRAGL